jgi:hypothetical protein
VVFGDDFTPNSYLLLSRIAAVAREIRLTGKSAVKFYLANNNLPKLGDIVLGLS